VVQKGEDDEAIMYFKNIFPRIKEKYGEKLKEMIFVQNPGDLVFVPGGWWHVVVNLDDTIAVTQNFCSSVNFPYIWTFVRKERKKMSVAFLKALEVHRPDLYKLAIEMNDRDHFNMYNLDERLLKKKKKKASKGGSKNSSSSSSSDSSSSSSSDSDSSDSEGATKD
jgi:histone arginine demethylase JMJD6